MNMLPSRLYAFALLCIQLPAFIYFFESLFVPLLVFTVGCTGFRESIRIRATDRQLFYFGLALALGFYFLWSAVPIEVAQFSNTMGSSGIFIVEFLFMFQATLLLWERKEGIPKLYPLAGGLALMFPGDRSVNTIDYIVFQVTVLLYMLLFALYTRASQKRQTSARVKISGRPALLVVLIGITAVSSAASRVVFQYHRELDQALLRFIVPAELPGGTRLNREVELGSVIQTKARGRTAIALRIFSKESPGYMRGFVYDQYRSPRWVNSYPSIPLQPSDEVNGIKQEALFLLKDLGSQVNGEETYERREIWPNAEIGDMVFTQLETHSAEIEVSEILVNAHGSVSAEGIVSGAPYSLFHSETTAEAEMSDSMRASLVRLPKDVDDRVRILAEEIVKGAMTTEEKIYRVVSHFQKNHQYNIGIDIPVGVDPVTYFLLEQPPGHCELFASGTVILLRLAGVPCRYVTCYVAMEENSVGDYWVARSKDAHAWVEAWDEGEGWVLVESTPSDGVPQGESGSTFSDTWENFKFWVQQLKNRVFSGSLLSVTGKLILVGIVVVVTFYLGIRGARWYWRRRTLRPMPTVAPEPCHKMLARMDLLVGGSGYVRETGETLLKFSERLREGDDALLNGAACWYEVYGAYRYNPATNIELALMEDELKVLEARDVEKVSLRE